MARLTMYNKKRGSGKTSKVIDLLVRNKDGRTLVNPIAIVSNHHSRHYYPEDIRDRVYSANELGVEALLERLNGIRPRINTILFDDSLLQMDFAKSCQYMYKLGRKGYNVDVYYTDHSLNTYELNNNQGTVDMFVGEKNEI